MGLAVEKSARLGTKCQVIPLADRRAKISPPGLKLSFSPFTTKPDLVVEVYDHDQVAFPDLSRRAAGLILDIAKQEKGTVLTPGCTTPINMYRQLFTTMFDRGPNLFPLLTGARGDFKLGLIDGVEYPLWHPVNFRHYFITFFLRLFGGTRITELMTEPVEIEQQIAEVYRTFKNVYVPNLPFDGSLAEKEKMVEEFSSWLAGRLPIDLIVCGLGPDGHIAFLGPGQADPKEEALAKRSLLWEGVRDWKWGEDKACACTRLGSCDRLGPPQYALTITLPVFLSAKHVVLLAKGDKAPAVRRLIEGPYDPVNFPAQYLLSAQGRVTILLDSEAAAQLNPHHQTYPLAA